MFLPVSAFFFSTVSLIQHPLKRVDIFLVTPLGLTELYAQHRGGTGSGFSSSLHLLVVITIILTLPGFCLSQLEGYRTKSPALQRVYNPS